MGIHNRVSGRDCESPQLAAAILAGSSSAYSWMVEYKGSGWAEEVRQRSLGALLGGELAESLKGLRGRMTPEMDSLEQPSPMEEGGAGR